MKENGNIKVIEPVDDYKRIHKSIIRNKNIDCTTLGVYCKIVVLGTEWQLNIKGLASLLDLSDAKVRKSISTLEREGYIKREANYHDGKLDGWTYEVYPMPIDEVSRSKAGYAKNNEEYNDQCCAESSVTEKQTTLKTDNTETWEDNNNRLNIIEDLKNNKTNNKEEDTNVSPKKIDYQAVFDCWNKYNGEKIRKVTQFTDVRKKAIKKMLDIHNISQEVLMRFFASIPFADQWLFHPTGTHKLWKPTFDWWMANTNGWLTKGLEGGVHLENPQAFERIMKDGTFSSQSIMYLPQGRTIWYDEITKSYWSDDYFYDGTISDGYTDDDRPNGATITLNNGRGTITWDSETKKWNKI